jgi:hypothetical protein
MYVIATLMPKKMVAKKLRKLTNKIVIHTVRKLLGFTIFASAFLLPLDIIFLATQVGASEQTEPFTLMQLNEVSGFITTLAC